DDLVQPDACRALFDALGSTDKTLIENPGGHLDLPRTSVEESVVWLDRKLAEQSPTSPPRRPRSPSWPGTGALTRRSAASCSSAPAPSSGTWATCSPSWASPHARTSADAIATPRPFPRRKRPKFSSISW